MTRTELKTMVETYEFMTETVKGSPAVSSLFIAEHFEKRHDNILRDIENLISQLPKDFLLLNFEEISYLDNYSRPQPAYALSRDAFALLAMGFTGQKALEWKLRYIEAFNLLEEYAQTKYEILHFNKGKLEGKKEQKQQDTFIRFKKAINFKNKGLSYPEIGKIIGMSSSGVKRLLKRVPQTILSLEV